MKENTYKKKILKVNSNYFSLKLFSTTFAYFQQVFIALHCKKFLHKINAVKYSFATCN